MGLIKEAIEEPAPAPEAQGGTAEKVEDAVFRPEWAVRNQGELDHALDYLGRVEARIERNEHLAAEAIARIEAWARAENDAEARRALHLRSRIAAYAGAHRDELLAGAGGKTAKFPHGKVAWRKTRGGLKTVDREALLAWAQAQPAELGLVRIREEPAIEAIKAHAEAASLIPPGMAQENEVVEEIHIEAAGSALARKE